MGSVKSSQFNASQRPTDLIITHSSVHSYSHQAAAQGESPVRSSASSVPRLRAVSAYRRPLVRASSGRAPWPPRTHLGSRASLCTRPGRGYYALERSMSHMSAGKARRGSVLRLPWLQERRMGLTRGCGERRNVQPTTDYSPFRVSLNDWTRRCACSL